jgi:hypothetical protein
MSMYSVWPSEAASLPANQPLALIFVVDAQDGESYDHSHVLQSVTMAVTCAVTVNPNIAVEVKLTSWTVNCSYPTNRNTTFVAMS